MSGHRQLCSEAAHVDSLCALEPAGSFTVQLLREVSTVAQLLIWIRALLICLVSLCTLAEWPRTQTGTDTKTHRINRVTPHYTMLVISDSYKIKNREREKKSSMGHSCMQDLPGVKYRWISVSTRLEHFIFFVTNTAAVFGSYSSFILLLLLIAILYWSSAK